jgi:hypothetical protein
MEIEWEGGIGEGGVVRLVRRGYTFYATLRGTHDLVLDWTVVTPIASFYLFPPSALSLIFSLRLRDFCVIDDGQCSGRGSFPHCLAVAKYLFKLNTNVDHKKKR